jgi:hypothetical protein
MKNSAIFQSIIIIIITLAMLEMASFLVFREITGADFSLSGMQNRRDLRIAELKASLDKQEGAGALYDYHPYLGYAGHPGAHPWGMQDLPFNRYGMISSRKYPYKKTDDEYVVAILGGSVAEVFSAQAEAVVNRRMQELHGFDRKVVLLSLATGGYKQPQQLFHLEYALLTGFDIDAVINIDGYNDLVMAVENSENRINPVFPSGKHMGVITHSSLNSNLDPEFIGRMAAYYNLKRTELDFLSVVNKPVLHLSVFLNLAGEVISKMSKKAINNAMYQMVLKSESSMAPEFRGPPFVSSEDNAEVAASIWARSSEMLDAICKENGITYVHILQPNQYVEDSKTLTQQERAHAYLPDSPRAGIARTGYRKLSEKGRVLKANGVPFHDLTGIFKDYEGTIYVDNCCHMNRTGNRIMGREIADILDMEIQHQTRFRTDAEHWKYRRSDAMPAIE